MKKIFTLLFAVGTVCIASAQSATRHDNKFDSKPGVVSSVHNNEPSYSSAREKDEMIRKINFEFDHKIKDVMSNRWMRGREKSRQIQLLNQQRAEQIRLVQLRFDRDHDKHFRDHKGY